MKDGIEWGLTLISTSVIFLSPLIYKTNKELIDSYIRNASDVVNQQTEQVKQIASHHATRATDVTKQYVGEYSAKAQEMIGSARSRSTSPVATTKSAVKPATPLKTETTNGASKVDVPAYSSTDFPAAPKEEFKSAPPVGVTANALKDENEPLIAT